MGRTKGTKNKNKTVSKVVNTAKTKTLLILILILKQNLKQKEELKI